MNINTIRTHFLIVLFLPLSVMVSAQGQRQADAGEILHKIQKLNIVGSALYVAAHPDDENTRLISYLSNETKVRTAYLSLTRGDGGQNLIGPELREKLGVIRTQELLAARATDGGQQFFSRANDFGYSKTPKETLSIWDEEKVLEDMVWVIRNFKPDIMINRFDHRTPGTTHGHHTSSAMLSVKAFELAADSSAYPDQLKYVDVWQPSRLFFNTSWWFYGSREKFAEADKSKLTSVDIGVYYPLLGLSNNEIAGLARSQHKCQGFGTDLDRGEQSEYLELIKGNWPNRQKDLFSNLELSWNRLENGLTIGQMVAILEESFNPAAPEESLPLLLETRKQILELPDPYWRKIKLAEIDEIIKACIGLYFEFTTEEATACPGATIEVAMEAIARNPVPHQLTLDSLVVSGLGIDTSMHLTLGELARVNQDHKWYHQAKIPVNEDYATPYWLEYPWQQGMYTVPDPLKRGAPENPPAYEAEIHLTLGAHNFTYTEPLQHKKVDPAIGEIYSPFYITPPAVVSFAEEVLVFADDQVKTARIKVKALQDSISGQLKITAPKGWVIQPQQFDLAIQSKYDEVAFEIKIQAGKKATSGELFAAVIDDSGKRHGYQLSEINYDHIPKQMVLLPAQTRLIQLELEKAGDKVGYIMGAGDEIPSALQQVGYEVELLEEENISADHLADFDAIVIGIRAYNTVEWLNRKQSILFEYIEKGGTLITQYNTSYRLKTDQIGPYPIKISRERVTDETAPMKLLDEKHPLFKFPNKIEEDDFSNWVQERGLYFAGEWDERYSPLLSAHDEGEPDRLGSLLVAPYGKGVFVYTGISWFRQLPAGVPGAYRLFANLLALSQSQTQP